MRASLITYAFFLGASAVERARFLPCAPSAGRDLICVSNFTDVEEQEERNVNDVAMCLLQKKEEGNMNKRRRMLATKSILVSEQGTINALVGSLSVAKQQVKHATQLGASFAYLLHLRQTNPTLFFSEQYTSRYFLSMLLAMLVIVILFFSLSCLRTIIPQSHECKSHQILLAEQHANACCKRHVRLGAIDGMRGLFAALVLVDHIDMEIAGGGWMSGHLNPAGFMQFFFVVSGFVNATVQVECFDWKAAVLFIQKRMARLFPMFWISISLSFVECWLVLPGKVASGPFGDSHLLCDFEFLHRFRFSLGIDSFWNSVGTGHGPLWFVSTLLILSVWFPLLYNMCSRSHVPCLILIVLSTLARSSYVLSEDLRSSYFVAYTNPFTRLPEFLVGILGAIWYRQNSSHLASWSGWGYIFDASVSFTFLMIMIESAPFSGDYFLTGVTCIMCIAAVAAATPPSEGQHANTWAQPGVLSSALNSVPMQFLGRYSWSIYVLQWPGIFLSAWLLPQSWFDHYVAAPVVILLAVLADLVVDKPIQHFLDRHLRDVTK